MINNYLINNSSCFTEIQFNDFKAEKYVFEVKLCLRLIRKVCINFYASVNTRKQLLSYQKTRKHYEICVSFQTF